MIRRMWIFNGTVATGCLFVGGADIAFGHWQLAPIVGAAGLINGFIARSNFRRAARQEAHRPDYAKIARLEIELGLVEQPPKASPFVSRAAAGRREMYQAPDPSLPEVYQHPPMFKTYDDYMAYLRARTPRQE